jgi:hypothetical protein
MNYRRGVDFPHEGFVQASIEAHFAGWKRFDAGFADLAVIDPVSGQRWIIEAKGVTDSVGLDYRTGLGQVVQNMTDPDAVYAIAVPAHPKFEHQLARTSKLARERLGLVVLVVAEGGSVRVDGSNARQSGEISNRAAPSSS